MVVIMTSSWSSTGPCSRAPAHQTGVRERHARADFACGQTLADFRKVCTIKVSHSGGSLHEFHEFESNLMKVSGRLQQDWPN